MFFFNFVVSHHTATDYSNFLFLNTTYCKLNRKLEILEMLSDQFSCSSDS